MRSTPIGAREVLDQETQRSNVMGEKSTAGWIFPWPLQSLVMLLFVI